MPSSSVELCADATVQLLRRKGACEQEAYQAVAVGVSVEYAQWLIDAGVPAGRVADVVDAGITPDSPAFAHFTGASVQVAAWPVLCAGWRMYREDGMRRLAAVGISTGSLLTMHQFAIPIEAVELVANVSPSAARALPAAWNRLCDLGLRYELAEIAGWVAAGLIVVELRADVFGAMQPELVIDGDGIGRWRSRFPQTGVVYAAAGLSFDEVVHVDGKVDGDAVRALMALRGVSIPKVLLDRLSEGASRGVPIGSW